MHDIAGFDDVFAVVEDEAEASGFEDGALLVLMVVAGDDGAGFEEEAGEGHPFGVDCLPFTKRVELFAFDPVPTMNRHSGRSVS